jgi:hypothetical protein
VRDAEALVPPVLEPVEVVEVGPVVDQLDGTGGRERAHLLDGGRRDADDRVGPARDEARDPSLPAHVLPPVRMGEERVAQVGDPAGSGGPLHGGADEVHGSGRRRRHDDVDPVAAYEADRGRHGGEQEGRAGVGNQEAAGGERRAEAEPVETPRGLELRPRTVDARGEVAHAVHGRLRRRDEGVVAVHPLGVGGGEHVRLDAELRQERGQLQRTRHAAAARRRPVHGDEEDFHEAPVRRRRKRPSS